MKSLSIGIVIVNWNNKDVLLDCLGSLDKCGYLSSCLLVVQDNGSRDGSVEVVRKKFPEVKIVKSGENLGYAEGNNRGIREVMKEGAGFVFILNPDTLVRKGCIERLVEVMEKNPDVGVAGPTILDPEGKIWSRGGYIDRKRYSGGLIGLGEKDKREKNGIRDVDYISGTAMMVRREVFEKVGLFYPGYFIYYEDVELCVRARGAGYRSVFVPAARIDHKESSSFGKASPAHSYYMARNHLLFVERNAPPGIRLRECVRLSKTVWEHGSKGEQFALLGIGDYFLRKFGKKFY